MCSPSAGGLFSGKINKDTSTPGGRWDSTVRTLFLSSSACGHAMAPGAGSPHISSDAIQAPIGQLYRNWFFKEDIFAAANAVHEAAQKEGMTGHAVALRWLLHHSMLDAKLGDGMIIGASSLKQLEENLNICKAGPLPAHLVKMVDETGEKIRESAPPHSF